MHVSSQTLTQKYPVLTTLVASLVLGVTIALIAWQMSGPPQHQTGDYYYDLSTQRLLVAPGNRLTPFHAHDLIGEARDDDAASGRPTVVRAHVYGCGGCAADQRFIAYLEMHNLALLNRGAHPPGDTPSETDNPDADQGPRVAPGALQEAPNGTLLRSVDGDHWFIRNTAEARAIVDRGLNQCHDVEPVRCFAGSL